MSSSASETTIQDRADRHPDGTAANPDRGNAGADVKPGVVGRKWRWMAFGAVITAAMMDLLDSTIAQVAAPTIRRELGGSYAVIEWVTAAYALAMAVGLLTGGRLGDIFGRRRVLLTGITGFVLASAACAAAQSAGELIAARAAQGLLGAIMLPQVFGLIRDLFEAHEMGQAFGVYGPVMGLSAMLGPIAAGGLISANVLGTGWRMIFLVNVPVGLAALLLGARTLPGRGLPGGACPRTWVPAGGGAWTCRARRWPARPCSRWSSRWRRGTRWAGRPGCSGCWAGQCCCWPGSAGTRCAVSARAATRWSSRPSSGGMSLGIAGIGAIFFALASGHGSHVPVYQHAAEWTALATVGLLAGSFAIGFGLPRRAREQGQLFTRYRSAVATQQIRQVTARREGHDHERNRMGGSGRGAGHAAGGGRRGSRGRLAAADAVHGVGRHSGAAARRARPAGVGGGRGRGGDARREPVRPIRAAG